MANEINVVLPETGLTLVAKFWNGSAQVGSDIPLTENVNRSGHYYGDAPASITDGRYMVIVETSPGGVVKGFTSQQYIDDELTDGGTQLDELHKIHGLQVDNALTVTPTSRSAGAVSQVISGDGIASSTVTRT